MDIQLTILIEIRNFVFKIFKYLKEDGQPFDTEINFIFSIVDWNL